ncbi:MAG TPA: Asp23/Gls24 family envelope stress response protein [Anaerolineae bacterium]|nr:Asp23/Gls24 family envelope stress response protein [Anaerolineae bacterium]
MDEVEESLGRIEVAPEVLTTIAHEATKSIEGIAAMSPVPNDVARLFRRSSRQANGITLDIQDGSLTFDIYILVDPQVNVVETSRQLQTAVIEAIDKMVGIEVTAVNVHVEDVLYDSNETV